MPPDLPAGEVTFLFTDIEGSTGILERLGFDATIVFDAHDRILRRALTVHGGVGIRTGGDSFFVVFADPDDALAAAVAARRALRAYPWPAGGEVRVRIGIHTGEAAIGESGYVGLEVHRAARVCEAATGGRVLLSSATAGRLRTSPPSVWLEPAGAYRLKGFGVPEALFEARDEASARGERGALAG